MTINELIEKAHSQAKEMGWWDRPRNTGELLMLIVSECGEALEAHRSGKMGSLERFMERQEAYLEKWTMLAPEQIESWPTPDEFDSTIFREEVKDSFPDELADIVIRIADLMGDAGLKYNDLSAPTVRGDNVGEDLLTVTRLVCADHPRSIEQAITEVFGLARKHDIDLWKHIELKLAYNRTRGVRHGKAY